MIIYILLDWKRKNGRFRYDSALWTALLPDCRVVVEGLKLAEYVRKSSHTQIALLDILHSDPQLAKHWDVGPSPTKPNEYTIPYFRVMGRYYESSGFVTVGPFEL